MNFSFLPGNLHLKSAENGEFVVELAGQEVIRTRRRGIALRRFNELRREMEAKFPQQPLSASDQEELLKEAVGDSLLQHNSLGGRKKKTTAGATRTFGG